MASTRRKNGFTLSEVLVGLLIASVLCLCSLPVSLQSEVMQLEAIKQFIIDQQLKAIVLRERRTVEIHPQKVLSSEEELGFKDGLACTPVLLEYNAKGHPLKATSFQCSVKHETYKFIIQLGSGRIRYEKES